MEIVDVKFYGVNNTHFYCILDLRDFAAAFHYNGKSSII